MAVTVNVSRFESITMAPPDPILGVSEAFKADTHETKLNLGVGAYRTEDLQPYVLNVVKKASSSLHFLHLLTLTSTPFLLISSIIFLSQSKVQNSAVIFLV